MSISSTFKNQFRAWAKNKNKREIVKKAKALNVSPSLTYSLLSGYYVCDLNSNTIDCLKKVMK